VSTPQAYKKKLDEDIFSKPAKVYDVFMTADYDKLFEPFIDNDLQNAFKVEDTQLQWVFSSVDKSERYPSGVETLYRAYSDPTLDFDQKLEKRRAEFRRQGKSNYRGSTPVSQPTVSSGEVYIRRAIPTMTDEKSSSSDSSCYESVWHGKYPRVWEIWPAADCTVGTAVGDLTGLSPVRVQHRWYPLENEPPIRILPIELTESDILPAAFNASTVDNLMKTLTEATTYFCKKSSILTQWSTWARQNDVPRTADVQDYIAGGNPLEVPLRDLILSGTTVSTTHVVPKETISKKVNDYLKVMATSSVKYRGHKEVGPRRTFADGSNLKSVRAPYAAMGYTIDELQKELFRRGIKFRSSELKKQDYIDLLDASDKYSASCEAYAKLPEEDFNTLAAKSEISLSLSTAEKVERS